MTTRPLVLAPDEFALLKRLLKMFSDAESVLVVKPGETLVVRVHGFTPAQVSEYNEALNRPGLPFRCLVVEGTELGVLRP